MNGHGVISSSNERGICCAFPKRFNTTFGNHTGIRYASGDLRSSSTPARTIRTSTTRCQTTASSRPAPRSTSFSTSSRKRIGDRVSSTSRRPPPLWRMSFFGGGFAVENRLPVLVCDRASRREVAAPDGFEVAVPETDDELAGVVAVTNEAYEDDVSPPSSEDVAWRRAFKNLGGIMVLVRHAASGEPAGSGICEVPVDHVSELATVGVRPKFRRQGLAAAVTSSLASRGL